MIGVLLAEEAVLGGEEFYQFDGGVGVEEEVYGAVACCVYSALVGEECYAEVGFCEGEEGGVVGLFEDVYAGEGGGGRPTWACFPF